MKKRLLGILLCTVVCVSNSCSGLIAKYPIMYQAELDNGLYAACAISGNDYNDYDFYTTCMMEKLCGIMGMDQKETIIDCTSLSLTSSTVWLLCGTELVLPANYYQQLEVDYYATSDNYGLITYDDEIDTVDWYYDVDSTLTYCQFCKERNLDFTFTPDLIQFVEEESKNLSLDTDPVKYNAVAKASYMMQNPVPKNQVKEYIENYIDEYVLNHTTDYIVLSDLADLSEMYGITIDNADELDDMLKIWMHNSSDLTSYSMIARTYMEFQLSDSELESEILDIIKQNQKKLLRNDGTYNGYDNQQYDIQATCAVLYLSEQSGQAVNQTAIEEEFQYQIEEAYYMWPIEDLYYLATANNRYLHIEATDMEAHIGKLAAKDDDKLTVREIFYLYEMCQMYGMESPQWIQERIDSELENVENGTETDSDSINMIYLMEYDWADENTIHEIAAEVNGKDLDEVADNSIFSVLLMVSVMDQYGVTIDITEISDILNQYHEKAGYLDYLTDEGFVTMDATMYGVELKAFCEKGEAISIY